MAKQAKAMGQSKNATSQMKNGKQNQKSSDQAQSTNGADQQTNESGDAVELLKNDHRKVEQLFQQYEGASDGEQKQQIAHQVCQELIVHTLLEEEIFYAQCRENDVEDDMLDEAQVEHDGAKVLITELLTLSPDSEYYDAKVKVLSEYIKHHVQEEEKDDGIFAKAEETDMDMEEIGKEIQERKQELMQKAQSGRLRLPQPRALFSLMEPSRQENQGMPRMGGRERDEYGRFESQDDDRRGGGGRGRSSSNYRERDEEGRFMSDDDRGHSRGGRSSGSNYRERDDQGRFMSDDDRGYSSRSSRSRYEDDDDDRRSSRGRGGQGHGGWFGDSEGHSQAAQRGWEDRGSSRSSRYSDDDDDRRLSSRSGGGRHQGHGGWFGDSEGHSEAAQRGWEERGHSRSSRSRDDDDDRRYSQSSRGSHSGGSSRSRYEDEDDDRRSSSRGSHQGHGGWFGDSRGHSQAARRGWENRD
jgi:hypothetical protein